MLLCVRLLLLEKYDTELVRLELHEDTSANVVTIEEDYKAVCR